MRSVYATGSCNANARYGLDDQETCRGEPGHVIRGVTRFPDLKIGGCASPGVSAHWRLGIVGLVDIMGASTSVAAFFKALVKEWHSTLGAIFGLGIFQLISQYIGDNAKYLFYFVSLLCFLFAPYSAWRRERSARVDAERSGQANDRGHLVLSGETYNVAEGDTLIIIREGTQTPTTINLPRSPAEGYRLDIKDAAGIAQGCPINVFGNGHNIDGYEPNEPFRIRVNRASFTFSFFDGGWHIM